MDLLNKKGVGTRPFFFPLHKQPIVKKYNKQELPNSEYISKYGFLYSKRIRNFIESTKICS